MASTSEYDERLKAAWQARWEFLRVNNESIRNALKTLDDLRGDPTAQTLYDQRWIELAGYVTDLRGAYQEGFREGWDEGYRETRNEDGLEK